MPWQWIQITRFNQSDGSVYLIVQTGFLAKNQLLFICLDPFVIPNLARTCKGNTQIDFYVRLEL